MKTIALILLAVLWLGFEAFSQNSNPELDKKHVEKTLMHYIEGTANGQPERLKKAFHPDFNLYSVTKDTLRVWKGQDYISNVKEGEKANRIGRILSIDIENDAAMAKVEVLIPERQRIFTDYFLLLKYQGTWKIIHKSFSWREMPKTKN